MRSHHHQRSQMKRTLMYFIRRKRSMEYKIIRDKFPFLKAILDNTFFSVLVNLLTLFALFGDDIRRACFDKTADNGFDGITIVCMVSIVIMKCIFTLEILFACLVREGYLNSFFFWLDIISTLS